jgi:hypothetical protein
VEKLKKTAAGGGVGYGLKKGEVDFFFFFSSSIKSWYTSSAHDGIKSHQRELPNLALLFEFRRINEFERVEYLPRLVKVIINDEYRTKSFVSLCSWNSQSDHRAVIYFPRKS